MVERRAVAPAIVSVLKYIKNIPVKQLPQLWGASRNFHEQEFGFWVT